MKVLSVEQTVKIVNAAKKDFPPRWTGVVFIDRVLYLWDGTPGYCLKRFTKSGRKELLPVYFRAHELQVISLEKRNLKDFL